MNPGGGELQRQGALSGDRGEDITGLGAGCMGGKWCEELRHRRSEEKDEVWKGGGARERVPLGSAELEVQMRAQGCV